MMVRGIRMRVYGFTSWFPRPMSHWIPGGQMAGMRSRNECKAPLANRIRRYSIEWCLGKSSTSCPLGAIINTDGYCPTLQLSCPLIEGRRRSCLTSASWLGSKVTRKIDGINSIYRYGNSPISSSSSGIITLIIILIIFPLVVMLLVPLR